MLARSRSTLYSLASNYIQHMVDGAVEVSKSSNLSLLRTIFYFYGLDVLEHMQRSCCDKL